MPSRGSYQEETKNAKLFVFNSLSNTYIVCSNQNIKLQWTLKNF